MGQFELYFVAFYKHSAPQHLVAGPFIDYDAAEAHAKLLDHATCIVKTTLPCERAEW